MTDDLEVFKAIPANVVERVYTDGVADTLREVSKIGIDAAKTIRLILFPLQLAGFFQDRLASYIDRAFKQVPEQRRVAPTESLALQISEKLRFQEESSILTEMYINLLARAMDRDRAGEAHPAFLLIISQLAPDEVLLLEQISKIGCAAYMRLPGKSNVVLDKEERRSLIYKSFPEHQCDAFHEATIRPEELANKNLFFTFIEHLVDLGIVKYTNGANEYSELKRQVQNFDFWFIEMNEFGKLFHSACLGPISASAQSADSSSKSSG